MRPGGASAGGGWRAAASRPPRGAWRSFHVRRLTSLRAAQADNLRRALGRSLHRTSRWAAAVVALAAVALAGCGRSEPDLVNGKKLFIGKATCGSCHTLQHAGTKGNQGPNLDAAFENARQHGFGDSVIQGVVRDQIRNPRRGSIMPVNLVSGDDRRDVAAYVGQVAGKPGQDTGLLASVGGNQNQNKTPPEKGGHPTHPPPPPGPPPPPLPPAPPPPPPPPPPPRSLGRPRLPVRQGDRQAGARDDLHAEPVADPAQHLDPGPRERQGPDHRPRRHVELPGDAEAGELHVPVRRPRPRRRRHEGHSDGQVGSAARSASACTSRGPAAANPGRPPTSGTTRPPASSTISAPAAQSQWLIPRS